MRDKPLPYAEAGRIMQGRLSSAPCQRYGAFLVKGPEGVMLKIVSSPGDSAEENGWEHVSVSTPVRTPTWDEMCFVKDLFFEPEECVTQFHPPKSNYVNCHPYCLHLWRWTIATLPMPPSILVGPQ
jgi:hypothetical protein